MPSHEQQPPHQDRPPDSHATNRDFRRDSQPPSSPLSPEYTVITPETALGGATYPFLDTIGREWRLVTRHITTPTLAASPATLEMTRPTLRWVNGQHIIEVFVDGLTSEQFFQATGLEVNLEKGGFVLSKRLSRILRPYFLSGQFPAHEVSVAYLDSQDATQKKVWDGAGIISRRVLERLVIPPGVSAAKRKALARAVYRCHRVEFTLVTERGQDKGHAIVADQLPTDFVLPHDTKREVKLVDGTRFVGINLLHALDTIRLDIQSLINLYPFFGVEQLATWLDDEGAVFTDAVKSGTVTEAMRRIDSFDSLADLQRWPLREYFASGGQPLWFGDVTKNLMNQHLARLNAAALSKMNLPIPGGRFYVMPIGVGRQAGVDFDVPRGHIRLDRAYATAWVNDDDWCQLEDTHIGIANLLGGADNDDALWTHEFTDYDDTPQVLCWRSPNQVGEYVLLKPTLGSAGLDWATLQGTVQYPPGDSRTLPPRKDTVQVSYQQAIDPSTAGGLGEGQPYSVEGMNATVRRARANAGALGMYCNLLMISQAVFGKLPAHPPAPLEDVIDGSVKTGVDLSAVRQWCYDASAYIIQQHIPIPALLSPRVLGASAGHVTQTTGHWVDTLEAVVKHHIANFSQQRDELVKTAMPPAVVFDHAFNTNDVAFIETGAQLHHVYTNALRLLRTEKGRLAPADYEAARVQAEGYLNSFSQEEQTALLRGAIVSAYLMDTPVDTALWLSGVRTDQGRLPGIAHKTMQALREIGVLDEVGETGDGLLAYPGASISEPIYPHSIGITGVWFNWLRAWQEAHRQPLTATPGEVSKPRSVWAKTRVSELAQTQFRDLVLTIQTLGERKVAITEHGNLFGYISKESTDRVPDGRIVVHFAICHDGNFRCVWSPFLTE
ncbi:MAG: hypothetical protein ACYDBJ_00675 [Aggregatilineales bacterium]